MELIRNMYINDPNYFIVNKQKKPITILIELLKIFKDKKNNVVKIDNADIINDNK